MHKFSRDSIINDFIGCYKKLIEDSPHLAVHNFRCENSDYSDQLNDSKNAYVCFNGYGLEDCYYTYNSRFNKNCADLTYSDNCELCCECIDCDECYNGIYLQDCERCIDCSYCFDCLACQNCFGCIGLRRAEFHIFNKPYSKEEYKKKLAEIKMMPNHTIQLELQKLRISHPHVSLRTRRSEECFGDYIYDSKNVFFADKVYESEDCVYASEVRKMKDSVDVSMLFKSELLYEAVEATDNYNCNFMYWCANCTNSEYVMYCFDCENCFGGFNLKRKKYCILNQLYEKEAYFKLVGEIKKSLRASNNYKNFLPDIVKSVK